MSLPPSPYDTSWSLKRLPTGVRPKQPLSKPSGPYEPHGLDRLPDLRGTTHAIEIKNLRKQIDDLQKRVDVLEEADSVAIRWQLGWPTDTNGETEMSWVGDFGSEKSARESWFAKVYLRHLHPLQVRRVEVRRSVTPAPLDGS